MTTIKEYKAMIDGATDGPWEVSKDSSAYMKGTIVTGKNDSVEVSGVWENGDASFIATSRNIAPDLIRVIELAEEIFQIGAGAVGSDTGWEGELMGSS